MSRESAQQIAPNVFWVGAEDWNRRIFDGLIPLPYGTSYNSYLINGEKVVLVDTVQKTFQEGMLQRISTVVNPESIDYVVMNHAEPDHAGSIPRVLEIAKNAKLIVTKMGAEMARIFHGVPAERVMIVKDSDMLDLGGKTLRFIEAPWLHWPETMFTYTEQDGILFSCDFFGAHIASSKKFEDEVGMGMVLSEARRYYAEIMMPFQLPIGRALDKVKQLHVKMIAPSHGPVHRDPKLILDAYENWTRGSLKQKAVVIYVTMWGSSETLEKAVVESLTTEGIETVPYNLLFGDVSLIMSDLIDTSAILIGAPTVLNSAHPLAVMVTEIIRMLKPRAKLVAIFGSYGWGGGAAKTLTERFKQSGFEVLETLEVRGPPTTGDLQKAADLGKRVAMRIKEGVKL